MRSSFAPHAVYSSVFEPEGLDHAHFKSLVDNFWKQIGAEEWANGAGSDRPIRIISIGYGSGRIDLPLVSALGTLLEMTGCIRSINVMAIEPLWCNSYEKAGVEWLRSFGFLPDGPSGLIFSRGGIRLEISPESIESWQLRNSGPNQLDIILALFTVHLLDDWKDTLARVLENLRQGGFAVFGENTGTVCCLDGKFANVDSRPPTTWELAWRNIFRIRDSLLLPRLRIVSPRSLGFLSEALVKGGYTSRARESTVLKKTIDWNSFIKLVETAEDGPDASTFQTLRILDVGQAKRFVTQAKEELNALRLESPGSLDFDLGISLLGYQKTRLSDSFHRAVGETSVRYAPYLASTTRSLLKRSIAQPERPLFSHDSPARSKDRREAALASALSSLREALCLSRDSLMVFNSRRHSRYLTALTLLPHAVIGKSALSSARLFATRYAFYISGDPKIHLSRLLVPSVGKTLPWGDLTVEVSFLERSNQEIDLIYDHNGLPCYLRIDLPRESAEEVLTLANNMFHTDTAFESLPSSTFTNWGKKSGFGSFFTSLAVEPSILARNLRANNAQLSELENKVATKCNSLRNLLLQRLDSIGLKKEYPEESSLLEDLLSRILRLAFISWNGDTTKLSWSSCIFTTLQSAYPSRVPVGSGLFMMLTESDREALLCERVEIGARDLPWLMAAIQPFLSFLQDIEMADYAAECGSAAMGSMFSHEVKNVCGSITAGWIRPIGDWFELKSISRPEGLPNGKIGTVYTSCPENLAYMGVAAVRQLVLTTGEQIRLWCGLTRCGDLPFSYEKPATLESFIWHSFRYALDVMLVHALYSTPPKSEKDLETTISVSALFTQLFMRSFQNDSPRTETRIRWHYDDTSEESPDPTLALGIFFISMLCNVIQHADPRESIHVNCSIRGPRLQISLRDYPRKNELSGADLAGQVNGVEIPVNIANPLATALNVCKQSMRALRSTLFSSTYIMNEVLQHLDGSMLNPEEPDGKFVQIFDCDALRWQCYD